MTKQVMIYALLGSAVVQGVQFAGELSNQTVQFEFPPVGLGPIRNVSDCTDPAQLQWCGDVWCPENGYKFPNQECIDKCEGEQGCCPDSNSVTGYSKCSEEKEEDDLAKKFYIAEGTIAGASLLGYLWNACKKNQYVPKDKIGKWTLGSFITSTCGMIGTALGSVTAPTLNVISGSILLISTAAGSSFFCLRKINVNENQQALLEDDGAVNNGHNQA